MERREVGKISGPSFALGHRYGDQTALASFGRQFEYSRAL